MVSFKNLGEKCIKWLFGRKALKKNLIVALKNREYAQTENCELTVGYKKLGGKSTQHACSLESGNLKE